ncbi:MAG: phosphoribosyl-ATP diphosphatase [Eggerthellaceae bacterium]|jgi:phosphoribosyl-ATP pyrophosphohydrolase/phosphoribosyl-ATP pyrophosphohydrolase/phosphoribosyl-AMP cyclohydrolase|nr:phosphoribosyl-ATP diphosphatase [Eggerthellaceae bacterium]MCH4221258.1 phosphoribosyl-ATP diphosphatase [Eggerthellaceae bacterium]
MSAKTYLPTDEPSPESQIGATIESLYATIEDRFDADASSYTHRLLTGDLDTCVKKVMEEAGEVALAAKDGECDHLRYEAADVFYHLLVVLARFDIPLDELAAELNVRMRDDELPKGAIRLHDEYVKRGK